MPTSASSVAALPLPLPAGALNSAIPDPTVDGLLAYFAFWLQYDLNTKLANLQGTASDACPATNRFGWSPLDPQKTFVRGRQDGDPAPFPALYVWLDKGKTKPYSTVYDMRERRGGVLWIFEQIGVPGALVDRYGLRSAVEATLFRATSLSRHPSFSPVVNGVVRPAGQPIDVALSLAAQGFWIDNVQQGFLAPITESVTGSDQALFRAYPSVQAELIVQERIEVEQPTDADAANDPSVENTIQTDDPKRTLPFNKRYLPGFDQGGG